MDDDISSLRSPSMNSTISHTKIKGWNAHNLQWQKRNLKYIHEDFQFRRAIAKFHAFYISHCQRFQAIMDRNVLFCYFVILVELLGRASFCCTPNITIEDWCCLLVHLCVSSLHVATHIRINKNWWVYTWISHRRRPCEKK